MTLDRERGIELRRGPWAPSLDRITPSLGYTDGNVQIVTVIANLAKSDFTTEHFLKMCFAAVENMQAEAASPQMTKPATDDRAGL